MGGRRTRQPELFRRHFGRPLRIQLQDDTPGSPYRVCAEVVDLAPLDTKPPKPVGNKNRMKTDPMTRFGLAGDLEADSGAPARIERQVTMPYHCGWARDAIPKSRPN